MTYQAEIDFARAAALMAGQNAIRIRAEGIEADTKTDGSPVTFADRDNERRLCELIDEQFPQDGIIGEEGTRKDSLSGRTWIIDPIDGTRDFVRGNRFWCVLIALLDETPGGVQGGAREKADSVVGVAHFPMLDATYWAARGRGAFLNDQRLAVSTIKRSGEAVLSPNGLHAMASEPYAPAMMEFMSRFWAVRSVGGALDAAMLAAGQVDVWLERKAEIWDLAPLRVIIEEAGGRFFALDGSCRIDAGNAVACTPGLEREVREFFGIVSEAV